MAYENAVGRDGLQHDTSVPLDWKTIDATTHRRIELFLDGRRSLHSQQLINAATHDESQLLRGRIKEIDAIKGDLRKPKHHGQEAAQRPSTDNHGSNY